MSRSRVNCCTCCCICCVRQTGCAYCRGGSLRLLRCGMILALGGRLLWLAGTACESCEKLSAAVPVGFRLRRQPLAGIDNSSAEATRLIALSGLLPVIQRRRVLVAECLRRERGNGVLAFVVGART